MAVGSAEGKIHDLPSIASSCMLAVCLEDTLTRQDEGDIGVKRPRKHGPETCYALMRALCVLCSMPSAHRLCSLAFVIEICLVDTTKKFDRVLLCWAVARANVEGTVECFGLELFSFEPGAIRSRRPNHRTRPEPLRI